MMIKKIRAIETKKYFCPHCSKQIDLDPKTESTRIGKSRNASLSPKASYAKNYYWKNRDKILAQQHKLKESKKEDVAKEKTGWLSGV
jgi:hypothetical protein